MTTANVFDSLVKPSTVAAVAKAKKATKKPSLDSLKETVVKTTKGKKAKEAVQNAKRSDMIQAQVTEQEQVKIDAAYHAFPTDKTGFPVVTVESHNAFSTRFVEVLMLRNAEQFSADTVHAINGIKSGQKAIDLAMSKPEFKEVQSTLLKNARIADSKQDKQNFIAVKVLVKIVKALEGIGQGLSSQLDPYTRTIAENLIALNGISNKSCLVSLSRSVEYSELEQQAALVKRYNCSANTAGTQASSTRMMLKHLDICNVVKGKNGDVITLQENERAKTFCTLFVK